MMIAKRHKRLLRCLLLVGIITILSSQLSMAFTLQLDNCVICHRKWLALPFSNAVWCPNRHCRLQVAASNSDDSTTAPESNNEMDESERLRQAAEKLRREIAEFQQQKETAKQKEERVQQALLEQQEQKKLRFSAVLPIAKPDGSEVVERIYFRPWFRPNVDDDDDSTALSSIITCEVSSLPLGVLLGEHEQLNGAIAVDEILQDDGFGARAGLRVGDIVRACSACRVEMDRPTWQLLAGGIGRPKTRRFIYDVDGRPLEEVMEAIRSNRLDPGQRPILLVVERKAE